MACLQCVYAGTSEHILITFGDNGLRDMILLQFKTKFQIGNNGGLYKNFTGIILDFEEA